MDSSDECRFVEVTLSRISADISSLLAKKSQLSERLNTLRAHTSVLPPETLATIFEHACQGHHDRYTLSSVCSHWHRVVKNTPSLFTFVSIHYDRPNAVDFLLHHHRHAKDIPLTVELHPGRCTSSQKPRPLFCVLLTDISHSLKSLVFHNIGPVAWSLIEAYSINDSAFPQLESLTLDFFIADAQQLTSKATRPLFTSPRLSRLHLRFPVAGLEERLQLENITLLEATSISSKQGMQFLARCLNIAYFSWETTPGWRRSPVEDGAAIPRSASPIILPFLETMIWKGGDIRPVAGLIRLLRLPSLHKLEWKEPLPMQTSFDDKDYWGSFFSSMSKLRILHTALNQNTAGLICCLPTIEVAEIICPSGSSDTFLQVLELLIQTAEICNLPRLKLLTLMLSSVSKSELDMIITMLKSRRATTFSSLESFILRVKSHDITEVWEERHTGYLKSLVKGGLKVVVWEDKRAPGKMLVL